jgi:cysteine desulfurase
MTKPPIYLDHAATTPVRPEVIEAMLPYFGTKFGNSSSTHRWGREARAATDAARERIAECLGANADEICLSSGGTEADNLAVLGSWRVQRGSDRNAVVTTPIEHKAVWIEHQAAREGGDERLLAIDPTGWSISTRRGSTFARRRLQRDVGEQRNGRHPAGRGTCHNRQGARRDLPHRCRAGVRQARRGREADPVRLSFGERPLGPKSIGAVFVRRGTPLAPLFFGGSQDRGRRPGTENTPMAVALATAMELTLAERDAEVTRLRALRDRLEAALVAAVPGLVVHGRGAPRVPHLLHVSVPNADSESLLMALDLAGVAASSGSACQSGTVTPSHVLSAMGLPPELGASAVRQSVGKLSTDGQMDRVSQLFPGVVQSARAMRGRF